MANLSYPNFPITGKDIVAINNALSKDLIAIQKWSRQSSVITEIASENLGAWTSTSSSFVNIGGMTDKFLPVTGSQLLIMASFSMFTTVAALDAEVQIHFSSLIGATQKFFISSTGQHIQKTLFAFFPRVVPGTQGVMVRVRRNSGAGVINTDTNDSIQIYGLQIG